jgi:hypothetical protein
MATTSTAKGASEPSTAFRRMYVMNDDHYLILQANIIFLLLFLVGTTTVIQHPEWFQ